MISNIRNSINFPKKIYITAVFFLLTINAYSQITSISISLSDKQAGKQASYTFSFTTSSTIPANGVIAFYFPSGFGLSSAAVTSSTIDGTFTTSVTDDVLYVHRSGDGTNTSAGNITIVLDPITNNTRAVIYSLTIETRTNAGTVIDTGDGSFEILFEDDVDSYSIVCSTLQTAGTGFSVGVTDAVDQYGNHWSGSGWVSIYSGGGDSPDGYPPVLNHISIYNGDGHETQILYNAQPTVFELSVGGMEQRTDAITVRPGPLGSFEISGEPVSAIAGQPFTNNLNVSAYDAFGNVKTNYTGSVDWTSTDQAPSPAVIPVDDGAGWANGAKEFSGSSFTLFNGPTQTLTVTDQTINSATGTSDAITVTSNPNIADYDLTLQGGEIQKAGAAFNLAAENILDQYGNSWSGSKTINISVFSGGGNSPDIHLPLLNDISVTSNSGSANQILVNAVPTVLMASVDGKIRYTNPIVVQSGALDDFVISASASQTAGVSFPLTVSSAKDTMANPWTGDVFVSITSPSEYKAPDGTPPSINNIHVNEGAGSSNQTLTLTQATIFQGTAQSISRTTGNISVNPGQLYEFVFSGVPASVVAGGVLESDMTVTTFDGYKNLKSDFAGIVTWTSSDPYMQTVPVDDGTGWSNGSKTFIKDDFKLYRGPDQTFTVQSGSVSKVTNSVSVLSSDIAGFEVSCGRSQVAGVPFAVIVTDAQDPYGNNWGGTVNISTMSGGGSSPAGVLPIFHNIIVENGTGESYQTLVNSESGVVIQGVSGSVSDTVSNITVSPNMQPSALSRLTIRDAAAQGGQVVFARSVQVGEFLNLYAAGYDPYGNYRQDETVNWSSQGFDPSFQRTGASEFTFDPDVVGNGYLVASDPYTGVNGRTGTITVHPGPVANFSIDVISTQVAEEPFQITVSAIDNRGNIATDFTGTVQISDGTGSIGPTASGNFDSGVWTGYVTISNAALSGTAITVAETGAADPIPTGVSNTFNVLESDSPRIRIFGMENLRADSSTIANSVTAAQEVKWFVKIVVENSGQIDANLDSVRISFSLDNVKQTDYIIFEPDTFWSGGNNLLKAGTKDSLFVTLDRTGTETGTAVIQSFIYLRNATTGKPITDQGLSTIDVASPADVIISEVRPSQSQMTQGQVKDWSIDVVMDNRGGSSVLINPNDIALSFSIGNNWNVETPPSYTGSDWILPGDKKETLTFIVESSGTDENGSCTINAEVKVVELNTGRQLTASTTTSTPGTVQLEQAANLLIVSLGSNIRVNTGQKFILPVVIRNTGGDGVHDVVVQLGSNAQSPAFPSSFSATTEIDHLAGGEQKTVEIEILAAYTSNMGEEIIASLSGTTDNDTTYISSDEVSTTVVIDEPADISLPSVTASVAELQGGQVDPWTIIVAVTNTGGALVLINQPSQDDIKFSINNIQQTDYSVEPPDGFDNTTDRILTGGQTRTLIYTVNGTGRLGGDVNITADIKGKDQNSGNNLQTSNSAIVKVVAEKDFRIISTTLNAKNITEAGNGAVNTGQDFYIDVVVENGLGRSVKNVEITLVSDGVSISGPVTKSVVSLFPTQYNTLSFLVTAASTENIQGEIFTASITGAIFENSTSVPPIGASIDSLAKVIIQKPASLNFSISMLDTTGNLLSNEVSTNQVFKVVADFVNHGTAEIDELGKMQISLPAGYELVSVSNKQIAVIGEPVVWYVKAPSTDVPEATLYVRLSDFPREINTGNFAAVEEQIHDVSVKTIESWIKASLSVNNPPGAKDNTVSSGQLFWIKVDLTWSNCKNLVAELTLPSGYSTQDDLQKSVLSNYVVWPVVAPNNVSGPDVFRISTQGRDQLQDVIVNSDVDFLYVATVRKADLSLSLDIVSPVDARDGSVSIGQEFDIEASLENSGDAGVLGTAAVRLKTDDSGNLPGGYTTRDSIVKNMVDGKASWTITAPDHITGEAVTIEAVIENIPYDENTNEASFVTQAHNSVAVTTAGASLSVEASAMPDQEGNIVVPGENKVIMMVLKCENKGIEGANPILVSWLKFVIEDEAGSVIRAGKIFKSLYITDLDQPDLVFGRVSSFNSEDTVTVFLNQIDREPAVRTGKARYLAICGNISENTDENFFQFNLPNNKSIGAEDIDSGIEVPVQSPVDDDWVDMRSQMKRIFYPDRQVTLCNCPNPFGDPGNESTVFVYYLKESTGVSFMIFTLTGQLVWKADYSSVSIQGMSGMHDTPSNSVMWRGINTRGNKVLNGVYILVMKTGAGKIEKTKIAVVK